MSQLEDRLAAREKTLRGGLEARLSARESELKNTGADAFSEAIQTTTANNLLQAVPSTLAAASAGVQAPFSDRGFSEIFQEEKTLFPANIVPSMNQLEAAGAAFRGEFGQRPVDVEGVENPMPLFIDRIGPRFDEELARINERQTNLEEQHPGATRAGELGGDVLSIFALRAPFLSKIDKIEKWAAGKKFAEALKNPNAAGELGNVVKGLVDSKAMRSLMRGAGRAGEAGLEAAVLEAIKGDDPLKAAGYVAGGQALGSALLNISHGIRSGGVVKGGLKFAALGAAYTAVIQMVKSGVPGGENSILESTEEAFSHLMMLLLAGGVATVAGTGRLRGKDFDVEFPGVAEFISTLPRAVMISFATDYIGASPEEQQLIDDTFEQLREDQNFFGDEIRDRLLKAMEDGNVFQALKEEL